MLRDAGYYTAFKGKWHLSTITGEHTRDALEPYGFSDYQDFGEIWGEARDGYERDGEIAGDAAGWLTDRAGEIGRFAAVVPGGELLQPARHHVLRR